MTNVFTVPVAHDDDDPPGFRAGYVRLAPLVGAQRLGGSVYELETGQAVCPYHYEYGSEEWLVVLTGRPTLRTPEGERVVEPGDVVCFPEGPAGAHQVRNDGEETSRVLLLGTKNGVAVGVYPDSDKIGIFGEGDDAKLFLRKDAVDYWEGEARKP